MPKFDIHEIQPRWVLEPESMGSKSKFWYLDPSKNQERWLFKLPHKNTGEHWAEKIAAEVANKLEIKHAEVELAVFKGQKGSTTKSFVNTSDGWALLHGNQLLFNSASGYDREMTFGQNQHTLEHIWESFEYVFKKRKHSEKYKVKFAAYLILDAIIGNTDRHHENWGLLRKKFPSEWRGFLAPSFDHASSLGRELQDKKRNRLISEGRVGHYVENGHGGIFWSEREPRGPSPLELVRRSSNQHPNIFGPGLEKVKILNEKSTLNILNSITEDWMSEIAKKFTFELMRYSICELRKLL